MFAGHYRYLEDLLAIEACIPSIPWVLQAWREIVTPLDWRVWDENLSTYPDQQLRRYIVDGIKGGFRIGFNYAHSLRSTERNMHSVKSYPEAIEGYLAEECAAGRIIGPLPRESAPGVQVSRFGLIPQKPRGNGG